MSPITSHVLDTALGKPAVGVALRLFVLSDDNQWIELAQGVTDTNGRVLKLLPDNALEPRNYRLSFETGAYFEARDQQVFYERVEIQFRVTDASEHYHIPLLLSPFGYSTYRGS